MGAWLMALVSAVLAGFASLALAASGSAPACDLGIVGAGAGGAYAAWRAAAAGRTVCVFERAARPGGRIHSLRGQGPRKDLVVEAGGYRFAPKPIVQSFGNVTWKIDTPLTAKIIKELRLPTATYNPDPSQWDHGMHKIVDEHGQDAGYLTFIERMLELAANNSAEVRFNAPVVAVGAGAAGTIAVRLESGEEVIVKSVLLNLPQRPVVELLRESSGPVASIFPKPLYNPVSFPLMKLYVHYKDAWWRNDLGLKSGPFYNKDTPSYGFQNTPAERPAPLEGQYHDGDVRCDLPGGRCRGFLQAYYGGDDSQQPDGIDGAMRYFDPFVDSLAEDAAVQIGTSMPHHRELLEAVHAALVELHRPALEAAGVTTRVSAMSPTGAILSMWNIGTVGIHAGCHNPKRGPSGAPPVPGSLAKAALQPLPGWPIFVANEAFGTMNCFAEGSLAMAEVALQKMNVSLPGGGWLEEDLVASLLEPETSVGRPPGDPFFLVRHTDVETSSQPALGAAMANLHI